MQSNSSAPRPLRVCVTGAGGLLGQALCLELARRGHAVAGLVRRKGQARPADTAYVSLEGDVTVAGLDLATEAASLARRSDLVVHCAAVTGFSLPAEAYRQVNTGGTANVLAFAEQAGAAVLHVSTAYVCGADGRAVAEAPATASRFNNGYEASKAAAEALVLASRSAGRVAAVARPSIVVGRWADGQTGTFGAVYQLIRLVAEGRIRVLPASPDASLDLVPLDHVVGGLADIAERMAAADGRIFHLASGSPVKLAALMRLATRFPHLQAPRLVPPGVFQPAMGTQRDRWLQDQVVDAYAAYLRPSPRFAVGNLLALTGRACPAMDDAFLERMVAFAIAEGFLPGGALSAPPDTAGRALAAAQTPI